VTPLPTPSFDQPGLASLLGRCPACGQGGLWRSYLKFHDQCATCGADFTVADTGDGPAVFVVLIAGALVTVIALVLELAFGWSPFAVIPVVVVLTAGLCAALLPLAKGLLFGLQWRHRAGR
jgi:uncharacterized protein (DUF983 family)